MGTILLFALIFLLGDLVGHLDERHFNHTRNKRRAQQLVEQLLEDLKCN